MNVEWFPLGFGHNNEYKMAMQAATMAAIDQGIPKKFSISFLYTKRAKNQSEKISSINPNLVLDYESFKFFRFTIPRIKNLAGLSALAKSWLIGKGSWLMMDANNSAQSGV